MTERVATPEERRATIGRLLAEHGRLDVGDVAGLLGVAQETIRRDLTNLESAGVLRRVHGGAVALEAQRRVPIPTLATPAPDEAAVAGRLWAELPRTGTILIGSGQFTTAVIAAIIAEPPVASGLTIVTNSLDAAVHLARVHTLSVYNIGGTVSPQSLAQEGDWAVEELGRLRVDIAVLSPEGISVEHGLSESTPAAAAVGQAAVGCSETRIVLSRADQIGRNAFVKFAPLRQVNRLLVAGRPDPAVCRDIESHVNVVECAAVSPVDTPPAAA